MPLVPEEPSFFPERLLSSLAQSADCASQWWALHTRPRAEKTVARKLWHERVGFFLPLYERRWSSKGRRFQSRLPLFPGYLFLYGDREACLVAQQTNLLVRLLRVPDQLQLWHDLMRLQRLIQTGQELTPRCQLAPGQLIRIVKGPLAGLEGKVLRVRKRTAFVVEVHFLQRGVAVEIDRTMLQAIAEPEHSPAP